MDLKLQSLQISIIKVTKKLLQFHKITVICSMSILSFMAYALNQRLDAETI